MKLQYIRKGDYLYPNLTIGSTETRPIGKYGLLRKSYLKEHKPDCYQSMLLTGKLDTHLADIEEAANERMERLIECLAKTHPAPNKETNQLAWTAHMNMLSSMAEENILRELVYA